MLGSTFARVVALPIKGYFFKVYFIALLTVLFFNVRIEKMSLVHQEAAQKRQKQVENLLAFFYIIFSPEEFSLKWERG